MKLILNTYFSHFSDKDYIKSFIFSVGLLFASLYVNFYASLYASKVASAPVTDIILSNIRVYDVESIFVYGPWIFWIFITIITISKPNRIPFIIKNIAMFVLIRSVFITLTHIGPFPTATLIESSKLVNNFTSTGDLFFSAHTGLPFLMCLVFWKEKIWRYIMLVTSIFFGAVVLMGHLHYTIDVVAAFFITYSIFSLSIFFFKKDFDFFNNGPIKEKVQEIL